MIDFTPKGVDKGSVVRALADIWKISPDEIIAIGDECNDIPMLKSAGLGVAALNAGETVKQNAGYVTTVDCGKGAVAEVIERFIYANKAQRRQRGSKNDFGRLKGERRLLSVQSG